MVLDATALLLLLNDKTSPPRNPLTNEPIVDAHERVVALVNELTAKGERVIIAAPVLAELLVRAENAASGYMAEFGSTSRFRMVSFDQKAAIEHSLVTRKAIDEGDKFGGVPESWIKVKFDRQIVAIAMAAGAHTICTDDKGLRVHAENQGLNVLGIADLKLNAQLEFEGLDATAASTEEAPEEPIPAPVDGKVEEVVLPENGAATPVTQSDHLERKKGGTIVEIAPPSV
ncbi:MAG: hypothetical protein P4L10_12750 [Acidobacteriaceae bacterium]|nr:hypothetical protein [Acidobacteriaceae bacterium]